MPEMTQLPKEGRLENHLEKRLGDPNVDRGGQLAPTKTSEFGKANVVLGAAAFAKGIG